MTAWLVLLGLMVGCGPGEGPVPAAVTWPVSGAAASPRAGLQRATAIVPEDRWVAEDKARHFAVSFAATSMAYGGARFALGPARSRNAAVGAALLLGVGKELADARRGGPFSWKDLAWDAAGVALGYTLVQQIR